MGSTGEGFTKRGSMKERDCCSESNKKVKPQEITRKRRRRRIS
jgi:hypothetical protein